MKTLTVFTPTYNRSDELKSAYLSLCNQSVKDFVWLIIDDGSTDDTSKLVDSWIEEGIIDIDYHHKTNEGKYLAYNYALDLVSTPYLLVSLDSDDQLIYDAVEYNLEILKNNPDIVGVSTLWKNLESSDDLNGKRYYELLKENFSLEYACSHNLLDVEATFVFKTDFAKKYYFPVIKNEKFFTEGYIYFQMDGNMYWSDKVTKIGKYLSDGLSQNTLKSFKKYPNSWYQYNYLRIKKTKILSLKIKYYIYFIIFALLSKNKIFKKDLNGLLLLMLLPISIVGYFYVIFKGGKL